MATSGGGEDTFPPPLDHRANAGRETGAHGALRQQAGFLSAALA
jgi:hypothetical protein